MIGFIGLGKMGGGLAHNLLRKGHEVIVYDVRPSVANQFVDWGAERAAKIAEVARVSSVVFTSLPLPADVVNVVLGPDGMAPNFQKPTTVIDVSTIDPVTARHLANALQAQGHHFLACPLGKGPAQAEEGSEPIFAGGDAEIFSRFKPLLEEIGEPVYYLGGVEQSTAFKLISNHIGMTNMAILAEGLAVGVRAGISMDYLVRLLADTGAQSHQLNLRGPWVTAQDFAPRFAIDLTAKDMRLSIAMAQEWGMKVPLGQVSLELFQQAQANGWGGEDTAAIYRIFAESGE